MEEIKVDNKLLCEFAEFEKDLSRRNNIVIKKYIEKLNSKFSLNKLNSIYELFDVNTGAIYIKDEDSILMKKQYSNHPIFSVYDCDCISDKRKFTCNLDDKIILRGPYNYYYSLCELEDLEISLEKVNNTIYSVINFFENVKYQLEISDVDLEENTIINFKLVISILDCVRNILDINLFFLLSVYKKSIYVYGACSNALIGDIYKLLKEVLGEVYDLLFGEKDIEINKIVSMVENCLSIEERVKNFIDNNQIIVKENLYFTYRKYREADSLIENLICIDNSVNQFINKHTNEELNDFKIISLGLNYGSLELSVMTEVLLTKHNIECESGNIMKKFREVVIKPKTKIILNDIKEVKGNLLCILVDENILTGATISRAENYIREKGFNNVLKLVIKYPKLGRIKNIVNECKNENVVKMLKNVDLGMNFPISYSKFSKYRSEFFLPYLDELGIFDLNKYFIYKYLFKNGVYDKSSSINRLLKYYKDFFV